MTDAGASPAQDIPPADDVWDVPAYARMIPPGLRARLFEDARPVAEVPGLRVGRGLRDQFPRTETVEALSLICEVYRAVRADLRQVLDQRTADRAFLDAQTLALRKKNAKKSIESKGFATAIGAKDAAGRVVMGPLPGPRVEVPPVTVPPFMAGEQVTLFGPPDTPRMAINAMNAWHRVRPDEPAIVTALVEAGGQVPRWGADDEDSKTPIMATFLAATEHIQGCFDGSLTYEDAVRGKTYRLADDHLARPIKRFPGLALPDGSHLLDGQPLPLHLFDFVMHCWHNRHRPEALVFYAPKLENEEEAAYLRGLIEACTAAIRGRDPEALGPAGGPGPVRVLVVFENPRAIFRIREMAVALGPHFLGGSLGWHDFLASTARVFRHDPHYRIPVKADPNIVIDRIRESHLILAQDLGPSGALKLGGMYGVLFENGDARSYEVSVVGFIRDVTTQLKRGLDGFWVAHPDFVRLGLALVQAWRAHAGGDPGPMTALIEALVPPEAGRAALTAFVFGPDAPGLSRHDPRYPRSVLAADLGVSAVIANHDPEEVRYNLFQALQYLADWLLGNGCVALPATLPDAEGRPVFVRIMDDLATTERSRWEVWAEVAHGRVSLAKLDALLEEELRFIRNYDASAEAQARAHGGRRVQVRWTPESARWYPIAARLLRQLCTDPEPAEWVTELCLPFTFPVVRHAADPWAKAVALCPGRYADWVPPA